jgi:hypothetical protein
LLDSFDLPAPRLVKGPWKRLLNLTALDVLKLFDSPSLHPCDEQPLPRIEKAHKGTVRTIWIKFGTRRLMRT